ncbi:Trk system potassium transporter TrkA [Natrialba asiatica]|uniref:Potassium transporter peripheral membrane component n=1 Tax=Natrialba asiatica (strain ATCC 700177 / DSM 12278 / JCM 9576 / FERM P-10747 / NBRC 102637 / 172P1) TaxID=29540 RepID=M0AQC3_NATA1|nr:Trk system potassium transporter TrkA [Natrialba asiatica]ELZ00138.1 potassium transporter peripheral membrane component [Natrialba asiatica DSM 12278]
MRVIVVGAGEVGTHIADSLDQDHEVVVVDRDERRVDSITYKHDVMAIEGDGTSGRTLDEAGIDEADLVVASTDDDATNIVVCGAAKTTDDPFTIARVKKTDLLRTWERSEGAFGVDVMVSTDLHTAETIVDIVNLPGARDVDSFANGLVRMAEFEISPDSPVAGKTVAEADRFESLTFAALIRDDDVVVPTGETVIEAGDELVVIGSVESTREFAGTLSPLPTLEEADEIVIVGGSEIGYQTARLFEEHGLESRLVERDPERARELAEQLPKTLVLESDATDIDFLVREHVGESDIVIAALDSDEKNLLVSLLAKRIGVERTLGIVEYGEYVDLFETVGIDVAVNPRWVTAEEITRFTREQRTENLAIIEHDRAEVLEFEVDAESLLVDTPIREAIAELPDGVVVGAITRDGELITPRGETRVQRGDHVVVFAETPVIDVVAAAL